MWETRAQRAKYLSTYVCVLLRELSGDDFAICRKGACKPDARVTPESSHLQHSLRLDRLCDKVQVLALGRAHGNVWQAILVAGLEGVGERIIRLKQERVVVVVASDPVLLVAQSSSRHCRVDEGGDGE